MSAAAAPSGGTTARMGRPAAMYSKTFPERTPFPRPSGVGNEQEQRLRVALQTQRLGAGRVRHELEAVAEAERRRPLAVGRAEVADEASDGVEVACWNACRNGLGRASRRSCRCA